MILQRLKQFIDVKGLTIASFEKSIGMSNASFGKSLKNNGAIGSDKLENILSVYSDINPVWLLTGQGEMLSTHQVPSGPKDSSMDENRMLLQEKDARIAALEKIISSQDRTIELLEEKIAVLSAPPVVPVVDTAAAG